MNDVRLPCPAQPCQSLALPGCPLKSLATLRNGLVVGGGWDGVVLVLEQAPASPFTAAGMPLNHTAAPPSWRIKWLLGAYVFTAATTHLRCFTRTDQ